jgi:hypothetical protein
VGGGTGTAVALAKSAHAAPRIQSVCHSGVQQNVRWPLKTEYRVVAWCDSLAPNTQARGVLDTLWDADKQTDWFSDTGVKHYSGWKTPLTGITPKSRVEYSAR